ncbi:thiol-disulfide oxidoreductase DCC family protein [Hymenobacter rubripertinctus]|uniref:DUF393 domain-containing protein n=1 Tax=Hymenobacter rubripertinctus TaxID=2029981 RepID=A0A418R0V2_9BACT|nr:DCC1-like thiol-disulfide oxidoreductase family protein [Hymenobacter rubripertinctus]RIY11090.1 DUF393 domain-containing protein [Hymenobacter rubripertinctus]
MKDVIFFDGVCNLCDGFVHFVIDRDPAERFTFVSFQSAAAGQLLAKHARPLPVAGPSTIYLLRDGHFFQRSEAVLLIMQRLDAGWRYVALLRYLPRPLRDWAYEIVARNRYRILGREQACRIPTPALRSRFL